MEVSARDLVTAKEAAPEIEVVSEHDTLQHLAEEVFAVLASDPDDELLLLEDLRDAITTTIARRARRS
jgi:hypothetical protein